MEAAAFPDDKEPLWSTNFKRSISSVLQIDLSGIDNRIYTDHEVIFRFDNYKKHNVILFYGVAIAVWKM